MTGRTKAILIAVITGAATIAVVSGIIGYKIGKGRKEVI